MFGTFCRCKTLQIHMISDQVCRVWLTLTVLDSICLGFSHASILVQVVAPGLSTLVSRLAAVMAVGCIISL